MIARFWCAVLAATLCAGAGGCGPMSTAASSHHRAPAVLVDAAGRCPTSWGETPNPSSLCRWSREGKANAVTPNFHLPHGPWGIAYAYNCAGKGDFYAVVGVPAADAFMPDTQFYRPYLRGRGYQMETGKGLAIYNTTPAMWRNQENIQILSRCAWHVRVVLGRASVVRRYVPRLPTAG